jgi:hypothetical protein
MVYGTRNLIELKVGKRHTVQLQLHLKTCDIEWFNDQTKNKLNQLLSLLSKDVMPDIFNNEEIQNNNGSRKSSGNFNQETKGTKEKKRKATLKGTEPKVGGKKSKLQKTNKGTAAGQPMKTETKKTYLSTMETKYLFADNLQISYQVKSVQNSHRAILTYGQSSEEVKGKALSTFESLKPLPEMILVWCYPFDPLNPKLPIMNTTDGFSRPEFLPLSSLFKEH